MYIMGFIGRKNVVKVSIIVPIYNVENYLQQCLDSIINQTLQDLEIICVDDCGTDKSMDIVNQYAKHDKRIKIISHPHNMGQGAARNTGIKAAQGEYVGFVDSDDFIALNYFEKLYTAAIENNADLVQTDFIYYYAETNTYKPFEFKDKIAKFDSRKQKLNSWEIYLVSSMCWNKLCRRSMLKNHHIICPEGVYWEDNLFCMRAAEYANIIIPVSGTIYYYRQRSNSTIKLTNIKVHFDLVKVMHELVVYLNTLNMPKDDYLFMLNIFMERMQTEYKKLCQNKHNATIQQEYMTQWKDIIEVSKYPDACRIFFKKYKKKNTTAIHMFFKNIIQSCLALFKITGAVIKLIILIFARSYRLIRWNQKIS